MNRKSLAFFLLGLAALIALLAFGIQFYFRSSEVVGRATALAGSDPEVAEALGRPVAIDRRPIFGSLKTFGASGRARLSVPLRGPKGRATLRLLAFNGAEGWRFQRIDVDIAGRPEWIRIAIGSAGGPGTAPEPQGRETEAASAAIFIGALLLFLGLIFLLVLGGIRSSDVVTRAVERARANPSVLRATGMPIRVGWGIRGRMGKGLAGRGASATLTVPIAGPVSRGRISLLASRSEGGWRFRELVVVVRGDGRRIDLLEE